MPSTDLIQSLLVVFGFLFVVFLVSIFLKKTASSRKITNLGLDFKIVSKLPLTNKSILYIVQIGNYFLLVGSSENNITAIADLTKVFQSSGNNPQKFEIPINQRFERGSENPSDFSFKNFLKETFRKSKN
ncbi:MAG: flagellar biosynthetic protein FliO [Ignavibacteria bacterium]|nr:flagellar biosynthetic protein FliO [Ignavibacteria bacterium]